MCNGPHARLALTQSSPVCLYTKLSRLPLLQVGRPGIGKSSLIRNLWSPFAVKHNTRSTDTTSPHLPDSGVPGVEVGLGTKPTGSAADGSNSTEVAGIVMQAWEAEACAGHTVIHYSILVS